MIYLSLPESFRFEKKIIQANPQRLWFGLVFGLDLSTPILFLFFL